MSRNVEPQGWEWGDAAAANAVDESFAEVVGETVFSELLVASAPECFLVADDEGRIVFANPAVESVFGYDPEALVDRSLRSLIPDRFRAAHREAFRSYLDTGQRTVDWNDLRLVGRHCEGHEVPLAVWFREFAHRGEQYFVGVVRDISTRVEQRGELASERAFVESMFDALPDVVYAFDPEGRMLRWNDRLNEVTGYSDDGIESRDPFDFLADDDHGRIATAISCVLSAGRVVTVESDLVTADGETIPYEFTGAPLVTDGEVVGVTGVGRDISERKRYEATLERLDDLNTVIRSVDRALVEATTRGEIAREVCSRLVGEGAYCGAVIGSVDADGGAIDVDAAAGLGESMAEAAGDGFADGAPSSVAAAIESESVQVVDGVTSDFREAVDGGGDRTIAVVPLVADDRRFGLLAVCTDRVHGIPDRERAVLGELGATIGNAVQSALTRQLLHSDTITEIELRATDDDVPFVAVSAAADCRLELERAVTFGDEHVFFFSVDGASTEAVREAAASVSSISNVAALTDERIELRAAQGTITSVLTDLGARTTAGVADRGAATITAELPSDAAVREAVDAVQSAYPDTELVARREAERSLRTPSELRQGLAADLTDKQQAALEAAYFSGYFEWPARTSDAGGVADTLDIAPQTFHQHLRVAERKLLAALFDGAGPEGSR
ncbi:PAS domain S-box protein [Halosimplex pelagicum]|uniref:PAS domain S-box protein n=1 Tax=Halosimplex pelagicum TaxID=869886 RepID=A0A7D5PEA5_9EURY|nr:PAS domain S-box protein [Halosimplex pelagicum]QLH84438.1 PAS domain S-box protein [Halosimplex pelagicum]